MTVESNSLSYGGAISFGPFRLYPHQRRLECGDAPVKIGGRALDILLVLIENAGQIVIKVTGRLLRIVL